MEKVRDAIFSGKFYPSSARQVRALVAEIESGSGGNQPGFDGVVIGGVVPHAGYVYSARQAIALYRTIAASSQKFETVVVINPNHRGSGKGLFNACGFDAWATPLGKISIDHEFSEAMSLVPCQEAHRYEHSGEVQLPLLQICMPDPFRLVMVVMNDQSENSAALLAENIVHALHKTGRKILLIASSDFSHYEAPEQGFRKDQFVVDEIMKMNPKGVFEQVRGHRVTVCGYGPIMALMHYSIAIGQNPAARIVARGHSGEVFPSDEVVDYISMLFFDKR